MRLSAGTRLGPYEVVEPLGAGGMGEVYRGTDTRLGRAVAIKILSANLLATDDLRMRFEREAKAISSLNHPNICTLFDVGHQDGVEYLVMELCSGETLEDRIRRGPLTLDEVRSIGGQIAGALEQAHRNGIVHRDLKPGNVMLTPEGAKLLDFGLAKYDQTEFLRIPVGEETVVRPITAQGTLVGTFQYMAPEQLEGRNVDHRADIFSLGAVLYQMATGKRPFDGDSRASVIASVLQSEPAAVSALRPSVGLLDELIESCLRKKPEERMQSAYDVKIALGWKGPVGTSKDSAKSRRFLIPLLLAFVALLGTGSLFLYLNRRGGSPASLVPIRASIPLPPNVTLPDMSGIAISPDGRWIVFQSASRSLWLRGISEVSAHEIPETEGSLGSFPFWSPDSQSIGFFAGGKMKIVSRAGGTPFVVCDAVRGQGGTWNQEGMILFVASGSTGLSVVSSRGGTPRAITRLRTSPRDSSHRFPVFLPDGRHFVFVILSEETERQKPYGIYLGSLDSSAVTPLLDVPSNATYAAGHLFYELQGNLVAQELDPRTFKFQGDSEKIAEGVQYFKPFIRGDFSVSRAGVLAYVLENTSPSKLTRIDSTGNPLGSVGDASYQKYIRLSPRGDLIGVFRYDPHTQDGDVWIIGNTRKTMTRVTYKSALYTSPVWSPDQEKILLGSNLRDWEGIYVADLEKGGSPALLLSNAGYKFPTDWSKNGDILFNRAGPQTRWDIWATRIDDPAKSFPFIATPANDVDAHFSPDGRTVAYASDATGRYEVFVKAFPGGGEAVQVSREGGASPHWSSDGRTLYYLREDQMLMSAAVRSLSPPQFGEPAERFRMPINNRAIDGADYDPVPGTNEFLANLPEHPTMRQIFIDTTWSVR